MTAEPIPPPPPRRPRRRKATPPNFHVVTPACIDQLSVQQARMLVEALNAGGVVWFFSDCSWALAADPRHIKGIAALDRLLEHAGNPIPVTVGNETIAAKVLAYNATVRAITGRFWPGSVGIWTPASSRLSKLLSKRLHADGGVMVRMSRSVIERQLSDAMGLPITSAAMREDGVLVIDHDDAWNLAIKLHEERTPGLPTYFIRETRRRPQARGHSTMVKVGPTLDVVRIGATDPDDIDKVSRSNAGVNWGSAT